jgi:hypothetical protein
MTGGFRAVVLALPFAPHALRTLLDTETAIAHGAECPGPAPHVGEIAQRIADEVPAATLPDAIGTLLVLRSLGHITFPDLGAPCVLTASGRSLLALGDRLAEGCTC